jgi:hypothetical protein
MGNLSFSGAGRRCSRSRLSCFSHIQFLSIKRLKNRYRPVWKRYRAGYCTGLMATPPRHGNAMLTTFVLCSLVLGEGTRVQRDLSALISRSVVIMLGTHCQDLAVVQFLPHPHPHPFPFIQGPRPRVRGWRTAGISNQVCPFRELSTPLPAARAVHHTVSGVW